MDTQEAIMTRISVRRFSDRPVDEIVFHWEWKT